MHFNFIVSFNSTTVLCDEDHISAGANCSTTPESQQLSVQFCSHLRIVTIAHAYNGNLSVTSITYCTSLFSLQFNKPQIWQLTELQKLKTYGRIETRYDTIYWRALKSWQRAILINHIVPKIENKNKNIKSRNRVAQKNGRGNSPWRHAWRRKVYGW